LVGTGGNGENRSFPFQISVIFVASCLNSALFRPVHPGVPWRSVNGFPFHGFFVPELDAFALI
jgi:hypothetical protein